MLKRIWREDDAMLTFEWILLITLVVIGITGAMRPVRDSISAELVNVSGAIVSLDQSYLVVSPVQGGVGLSTSCSTAFTSLCDFGGGVGSSYSRPVPSFGARRSNGITPVPAICCS